LQCAEYLLMGLGESILIGDHTNGQDPHEVLTAGDKADETDDGSVVDGGREAAIKGGWPSRTK
jgi:hypothetical protein